MTWTTHLTYTAPGLTPDDIDALSATLVGAAVTYNTDSGRLQITLHVKASTLGEAADNALRAAAAATGLLKPQRLLVQTTADFTAETEHPAPMTLDLIGITEIASELGVSRQRAGQLADHPDFPAPVVRPASGRLYTRASVKAFHERRRGRRRLSDNAVRDD
jgi:hypothetical protein